MGIGDQEKYIDDFLEKEKLLSFQVPRVITQQKNMILVYTKEKG